MLEIIRNKILSKHELGHKLAVWKLLSKKVVFTNGCFDILHLGHIDYLCKASDMGDVLLIGLNSDASTSRLKGSNRPINDEKQRSMIVASLHFVDNVILFEEDTPYELIKMVEPDVLVKGSDYQPEDIVGADIVRKKGGEIRTIDYLPGYSTSLIEKRIREEKNYSSRL